MRCRLCGDDGHSKRTCTIQIVNGFYLYENGDKFKGYLSGSGIKKGIMIRANGSKSILRDMLQ